MPRRIDEARRTPSNEEITTYIRDIVGNIAYMKDVMNVIKNMEPEEKRWIFQLLSDIKITIKEIKNKEEMMPWLLDE